MASSGPSGGRPGTSGGGGGGGARPTSSGSVVGSGNAYGLSSLMDACDDHRRKHEGGMGGVDRATCIAILQKLKSVLPKLMKTYFK